MGGFVDDDVDSLQEAHLNDVVGVKGEAIMEVEEREEEEEEEEEEESAGSVAWNSIISDSFTSEDDGS